jgi:hypothetical protein
VTDPERSFYDEGITERVEEEIRSMDFSSKAKARLLEIAAQVATGDVEPQVKMNLGSNEVKRPQNETRGEHHE